MRHLAPWALTLLFRSPGSMTSIARMPTAVRAIGFKRMQRNAFSDNAVPCLAMTDATRRYLDSGLLRFFLETSGRAGRAAASCASCASLASLRARRRSMFLRMATALCSTSAIARTPSSWARRCLLARATFTGDDSANFLLTIFPDPNSRTSEPAQSWDRASIPPFQYIREMALTAQASDRFSALVLPRILSVLSSKLTF